MTVHWLETSFLPGYFQLVRANENMKLSIWIKTHGFLWYFVKLSYPAYYHVLPFSTPFPFVCLALLFSLICSSVLNRESKASAALQRLLAACFCQKTLKCGESNFNKKSCGLQRSATVKNRAVAVRRNMTALALFWSPGKVKCSLGCWPKLTTTPIYGQRDYQPALSKNCFTDVIAFWWQCVKEAFYFLVMVLIHSATTPNLSPVL